MALYRPEPVLTPSGEPVDRRTHYEKSARRLRHGETLVVADHYQTGVGILDALVRDLRPPADSAGYAEKQRYREAYREHAWRLLVPIEGGRVARPGAPEIGFLAELYPDHPRFWLPVPEVQDLSHAWHLFEHGVPMSVLGHRLHPFYGTYLPKRTEHLELFATWLAGWKGARTRAVDVGTGSGVLALQLARAGFAEVVATDVNPNACESVRRELARRPEPPPIAVQQADLLGEATGPFDLIVFNPPWVEGAVDNLLDRALCYEEGLFERFFDQAHARLAPGGRVVLVFSNILRLVKPDAPHPIEAELARGRFHQVQRLQRRVKPPRPQDGPARRTRERVEVWELAGDARIRPPGDTDAGPPRSGAAAAPPSGRAG